MMFAKQLRDRVMLGEITCSVRIWQRPRVKAGGALSAGAGRYPCHLGARDRMERITPKPARRSGFDDVEDLLSVAKHGRGDNVYLVEFEYRE